MIATTTASLFPLLSPLSRYPLLRSRYQAADIRSNFAPIMHFFCFETVGGRFKLAIGASDGSLYTAYDHRCTDTHNVATMSVIEEKTEDRR